MPVRTHLNTLFVTSDDTYLSKDGEAVVVSQGGSEQLRVPIHMLSGIVLFAPVGVSPFLMALCAERNVTVSFLGPSGRFLARVEGRRSGNVLLRKDQFRTSEQPHRSLAFARAFIRAKIHNCRVVLQRSTRDHGDESGAVGRAVDHLTRCLKKAGVCQGVDVLRGIEGEAARHYFAAFPSMVRTTDPSLHMAGRSRRPPKDPINAMLSFSYSLLTTDTRSACESVGLDPQVGFLHADRSGRVSLALDLAEEFRPVIGDRVVLSLVNRQQVTGSDFEREEGGAVRLSDDARRTFLVEYQRRKREELRHPFLGDKISLGLAPVLQARLLARALRGDTDGYPPFLWR